MRTWRSLSVVLVVVWLGSAAEVTQPESRQLSHGRRVRQLGNPGNLANLKSCGFRATDTPLGTCVIQNRGQYPWLIRIKFDTDRFGVAHVFRYYKGLYEEYAKNRSRTPIRADKWNTHTLMTGVLIATTKVLTTNAWRAMFEEMLAVPAHRGYFPNHFIWMFGYNADENCRQGRHAKTAIWHPRSNKGYLIGLLGDFGLYEPWQPFEVEGEPFLLQKPHPLAQIEQTITALIQKPDNLQMFLFYDDTGFDGRLLDKGGSKFKFIGLPTCRQLPNFKLQQQIYFDRQATNTSFFCGTGVPGSWNGSSNATYEGRGQDGASGAVAFYKDKSGKLLPLGLYDYWIGASGEPRFFAAFTQIFFDWLDTARFPVPITNLRKSEHRTTRATSTVSRVTRVRENHSRNHQELHLRKSMERTAKTGYPITSSGRRQSVEFWIAATTLFISM